MSFPFLPYPTCCLFAFIPSTSFILPHSHTRLHAPFHGVQHLITNVNTCTSPSSINLHIPFTTSISNTSIVASYNNTNFTGDSRLALLVLHEKKVTSMIGEEGGEVGRCDRRGRFLHRGYRALR